MNWRSGSALRSKLPSKPGIDAIFMKPATLLNYLVTESGQDAGTFYAKLPDKLRPELDCAVRRQLLPTVEQALRKELCEHIRAEEMEKLRNEIRHALVTDERWQTKARQALRQTMMAQVRAELQDQMRPEIEEQLTRELSIPLLIDASGQIDASVAAAIQRHLEVCKEQIRAQAVQEDWHQASTAIVEAFAAASTLDDDSLDDAMIAAMDAHETAMLAAYKAYENASVEIAPEDGVRKAVEAALTSLGFTSHCWREHWEWYCSRAKALINRRFFQISAPSETPRPMDGFYRAIQSYTCDRTGRQIEPGDYYLVFGEMRISLPMTTDPEMEWSHESPKSAATRLDHRPEPWSSPTDNISPSKVYRRNP